MKGKSRGRKGQFYLIATLLVAIVFVATTITTYSIIRSSPFQNPPKILNAIEEMNLAIKRIMEFTEGYYGSILQVTGNATYAKALAENYLQSGFTNLAKIHPDWNPSFDLTSSDISTLWYAPSSYSLGNISVTYDISGLGIYGIVYRTSSVLKVDVAPSANASQAQVLVTREGNIPDLTLGTGNFLFYCYDYDELKWTLEPPALDPIAFSNGTYVLELPVGVSSDAYMMQVIDTRGMMAIVSSFSQTTYTFSWNLTLYQDLTKDTIAVEVLQNGTLRWLGQNLQMSTQARPIPPIPVRALHVNQTIDGINREVAFQVEDWASDYQVPLGIASGVSVFTNRHMLVFLVNHHVQKVTLWWDGRDTAEQTSYATTNKYFTVDTVQRTLTNGILTLKMDFSDNTFRVISTLGTTMGAARLMRINNEAAAYGYAEPNYAVSNGSVRAVVQHEVEWEGDGAPNCPNVYAQIVLTLPANATYYTYALRYIFVNSSQAPISRSITDLCAIQFSSRRTSGTLRSLTENGTSSGLPVIGETFVGQNRIFYNFSSPSTGWKHHWSEYISGNKGCGMMFTDSTNMKLYTFDNIAGGKTGALSITCEQRTTWANPFSVYSRCGETSPYVASRAIDCSTSSSSYWWHNNADNHQIILDMGNTINITKIRIYQSSSSSYRWGGSSGVEVYVSNDPTSFGSPVWTGQEMNDGSDWQESGTFFAQGRYVKLRSKSTGSSQRLYEVQIQTQERGTIEFDPVKRYSASFTYPFDVTWHGAVVAFDSGNLYDTIYPTSGNISLWVMVERPPKISLFTGNHAFITVTSSPSGSGYVKVDGNPITTPTTFNWTIGSNHTLQSLSPVTGPAGTQYVWTGWSDEGAQTHTYIPDSSATVTANYKTQYQVSFTVSPPGSGTTTPSGTSVWEDAGVLSISANANSGYMFSSWSVTGSITITNPLSPSTTATISGTGIITANFVTANLALDGSASTSTSGSSMTISLTTSKPNDLLYISVVESQGYTVSGITSSPSLTWTQRASVPFSSSRHLETWYAVWPSSGTITITITLTGSSNAAAVAFGVSGADTASPFDGTPRTATGSSTSPSVTISTSNPNDFIIGALGVQNTPTLTTGSGFTLIKTQTAGTSRETSDEYQIVSTTQSNLPVGYSLSSSQDWAMIADVIKRA